MKVRNSRRVLVLSIVVLAVALPSCASPSEVDPNATAVAVIGPNIEGASQTALAAESIRAATITFYQTQFAGTPTAVPMLFTETRVVQFNSECRFGPGLNYGVVMSLFAGESVVLLGFEPGGTWFYIETVPGITCWILASLVTVPGASPGPAASDIPVLTPPPTPVSTLTPTQIPTSPVIIGTPVP